MGPIQTSPMLLIWPVSPDELGTPGVWYQANLDVVKLNREPISVPCILRIYFQVTLDWS